MIEHIAIQAIGFIGVICSVYANQQKSDKTLLLLLSFGALIFALQFWLMGAIAGAIMCLIGGSRSFISAFYKNKYMSLVYTIIYGIAGYYIVKTPIDIIPLIGGVLLSIGSFTFEGLKLRISVLIAFTCWMIYSIIIGSIGAAISELIQIISNIVGTYRLFIKPMMEKNKT